VVVGALDNGGLGAAQGFTLTAKANGLPVIQSTPGITATPGVEYKYDLQAKDPEGEALTYTLDSASQALGMTLDRLGRLRWTPSATQLGTKSVTLTVTDSAGAKVTQQFNLSVTADTEAPKVNLIGSTNIADIGDDLFFQALATDNVGIKNLQLFINNTPVAIDGNGLVQLKAQQSGAIIAKAIATDLAGNQTETTTTIQVRNPADTDAPQIDLDLSGITDGTITGLVAIKGSVSDTNLDYYVLEVAPLDGSAPFKEVFRGTGNVSNGTLGTFDPSLLQNDSYILRLSAFDTNGQGTTTEQTLSVAGELKLGNFRLSFTDIAIPVTGIPITLTRTYDTLTSNNTDDFGYGWRMEFRDTDLRTSLGKDETYEVFGIRTDAFDAKTRVYITLPGGKREGFTFKPTIDPISRFFPSVAGGDPNLYLPAFVADKGGTSTLSVQNVRMLRTAEGKFYGLSGNPYNPADSIYGGTYTLTTKEGIVYNIDAQTGDLLKVTDTNGNTLTYTDFDVTSSTGQKIVFERDAEGRITSVTDPMGQKVKYTYDGNGDLISVSDREGNTTHYEYSAQQAHYLDKIVDPLGRTGVKNEYDTSGRLKSTIGATGNTINWTYDPNNSLQKTTDALGHTTTSEYDNRGNVVAVIDPLGSISRFTYDENNNLLSQTDPNGLITRYTYDQQNNLISKTETYCGCPGVVPGITYYTYNQYGQNTSLTLPTGASLTMAYDRQGNLLNVQDGDRNIVQSYTYDLAGNVLTETDTNGITIYSYDDYGNVVESTDPDGTITKLEYDANNRLVKMIEADGSISTFTYDKESRRTKADYGNGLYVTYGYSSTDNDWSVIDGPTIGRIERKFTPDGKLSGWVTPDGGQLKFEYDVSGRLTKEIDPAGRTTEYIYDAAGRVTQIKDSLTGATLSKEYDAGGRVTKEIDSLGNSTAYQYARDGKLTSTTDARGNTWSYTYSGSTVTIIDPFGQKTTFVNDEYYLPTSTIYADGSTSGVEYLYNSNLQEAKDYITRIVDTAGRDRHFTYDSFGQLATATDIADAVTTYTYGDNGLTQVTGPTGEIRSYGYDADGNQTSITYGDGSTTQYSYSGTDNRLTQTTLASGNTIAYGYDDVGRIISQSATVGGTTSTTYTTDGAINTTYNSNGTIQYLYDVNGALSGMDAPNGSSIRYERDILGRVTKITEKASATSTAYVTQYGYDAIGNLSTVTDPTGGITTFNYDAANRLTQRVLPNGITTTYTYNLVDQVMSIVHKAADGTVVASITYERNKGGEPSKITYEDGTHTELTYDSSLRVTKEAYYDSSNTLTETITYSYDAAGKRTAKTDRQGNHVYNYASGFRLSTVQDANETEQYVYDADGRLTQINRDGSDIDLSHDDYDRLTQVSNGTTGQSTQYLYDAQGRRMGENSGTSQLRYLVAPSMGGGLDVQDLITDGSGNLLSNYIYVGAAPLMRLDANGNAVYYLTDGMGSVMGLANGAGQSIARYNYDGFGNIRNSSDSDNAASILGGDFRFQGQWLESESGLYYMRARDYDANTGRFISRDPVDLIQTEPESFDPYQFVYDNPYIFTDPTGEFTISEQQVAAVVDKIISQIQSQIVSYAKNYFIEKAKGVITDVIVSQLSSLLPGDFRGILSKTNGAFTRGDQFAEILRGQLCDLLVGNSNRKYFNNLWFEPLVDKNGRPHTNGFNCGDTIPAGREFFKSENRAPDGKVYPRPDFIYKKGGPASTDPATNPGNGYLKAYLVGDFKLSVNAVYSSTRGNQWKAIMNYAKLSSGHQYGPVAFYMTFFDDTIKKAKIEKEALDDYQVIAVISSLRNEK
jgi:RHS repeat-associated protein